MSNKQSSELVAGLQSTDPDVRYRTWMGAGDAGTGAIVPVGELVASDRREVVKAARAALEKMTHHAARPGAEKEAKAASLELVKLTGSDRPEIVRIEAIRRLGAIADGRDVPRIARLLDDEAVQDEARMAIEQIPGRESLLALRRAELRSRGLFRAALRQSIYNRGLRRSTVGAGHAR